MKNISVLILFFLFALTSCYRATNTPADNTPPKYSFLVNGGNPADSIITFTVNDSDSLSLNFTFTLLSGNPENHPITFYIDSLPSGITITGDSSTFKLAYSFNITMGINADTGYKTTNIKLYNPTDGLHIYPFRLHILPAIPPYDCANCMTRYWSGTNNYGIDSCNPVVALIPGMPHWVSIRNISCLGDSVTVNAYVSCTEGVTIPVQTSNGYTIYGQFNYAMPCGQVVAFTISDTIVHNGDTQASQFTLRSW